MCINELLFLINFSVVVSVR